MKATFVVHESSPLPENGGVQVVLRPVVNEEATNREWSPNSTPTGELRLTVTSGDLAKKLVSGQRMEVTIDLPAGDATVGQANAAVNKAK